jgi:D-alanyl-D-alanine carboxypeptidase
VWRAGPSLPVLDIVQTPARLHTHPFLTDHVEVTMRTRQTNLAAANIFRPWRHAPHPPDPRGPAGLMRRAAAVLASAAMVASTTVATGTSPAVAGLATPLRVPAGSNRADVGLRARMTDVINADVPGVVVLIQDGDQNGTIRFAAAGVADLATGAKLWPRARYRVGSLTKTFVATVVLQLVGEGRLGLDDPVARRLPGLLALGNRITVRQLLNHTSGLFDYLADPTMPASIAQNHVFTPTELVGIAGRHANLFPPGTGWAYSNTNFIVAGLLIEAVTHHRLAQELQRRIFAPLRLADTSFPVTTARIAGYHAHGYVPTDLIPTPDGRPFDVTGLNPTAAWAAGAIISNATDLATFYRALMNGRLLHADLLRDMKTTVAEDPAQPDHFRYGLGIERVQDSCGVNWGHGGNIFGYQDAAYWNEQTDRTVVIASTMFPAPAAAEAALSGLTDFALCGTSTGPRVSTDTRSGLRPASYQ